MAGSPRAAVRALRSLSAAFLIHAVVSGVWGPRLPAIKADLGLDDGELGTALAGVARLVRAGGALAGLGLGLGLLLDAPAGTIGGFFVLGLGLGAIVPIVFSTVGRLGPDGSGRLVAWAATCGYLGAIVGPIVIGWVADATNLAHALVIPVVLALAIPVLASTVQARSAFGRD